MAYCADSVNIPSPLRWTIHLSPMNQDRHAMVYGSSMVSPKVPSLEVLPGRITSLHPNPLGNQDHGAVSRPDVIGF
ncbi:hypothetical protein I79_026005 [Cricetulus griseus]|uniref:Uncharacterized protein n=1 Tax=Cricetulus griseus TaxID=10029 RepID=G3IPS9_CRIGR|nr:hypothetical protein I79_026005 [Cricetulus griseus]